MPTQLAARLLKGHRVRLSRAMARQIQQLVPRYQLLDSTVLERNLGTILGGIEHFLQSGDEAHLMGIMQNVMQLRALGGFALGEFLMATLSVLPVLRRFFIERSATLEEGLRVYESVESVALPLMGRMADIYVQMGQELPAESALAFEKLFQAAGKFMPARIETVQGDDSDEG